MPSNFQPIRSLDLDCCYEFAYFMANSADPDQLASEPTDLDLHRLQRQGIIGFSRTRVKVNIQDFTSTSNVLALLTDISYFI